MAKKQKEKFLRYIHLLDQLYIIGKKGEEEQKISIDKIRNLKFVKTDPFGNTIFINNYNLHLAKHDNELVILMTEEL